MHKLTCLLAALSVALFSTPALAKLSADDLQAALAKAKVFDSETRFTTTLTGTELSVSTYKAQRTTEQDCKIDAVLAAKAAFSADETISRVIVRFYDERVPGDYLEVPVTVGDVISYANGQISKERLLSAIKLTHYSASQKPESASTKATESAAKPESAEGIDKLLAGIAKPETKPATTASRTSQSNSGDMATYANYGISFQYPKTWKIEFPRSGNTLLRLYMPAAAMQTSVAEVRIYSKSEINQAEVIDLNPEDMFRHIWRYSFRKGFLDAVPGIAQYGVSDNEDELREQEAREAKRKEEYFRKTGIRLHGAIYTAIKVPSPTNCGANKAVRCLQRAYYAVPQGQIEEHHIESSAAQAAITAYMHLVVFERPPYVVQFDLLCPYKNAYACDVQFNKVLDTIRVNASKPSNK